MKLTVFSHKACWRSATAPSGFATDGGFPFQMESLSELFDATELLVPIRPQGPGKGEVSLRGHNFTVVPLSARWGSGLASKLGFVPWLCWNSPAILRALLAADAIHAPVPSDVGTVGMVGAWLLRKPLFVRYCGNWLTTKSTTDRFWHWFMESTAGGRNVMLATGGTDAPPCPRRPELRWIFATSLTAAEIRESGRFDGALDPTNLRLITVGRQDGGKGTEKVIAALALLRHQRPNTVLDIVGDGSNLPELKRLARDLGCGDRVTFHGKVDHAGVLALLRNAHLFCFPTESEGFPKAVLEALACGLPVIATPVSALPGLLANGCGVLIEPTPAAIEQAVIALAVAPELYKQMSTLARETACQYSLEHWRDAIGGYLRAAWGPLRTKVENGKPEAETRDQKIVISGP